MNNIAILGAGAVGCFVGGKLRANGHRVVFVGRQSTVDTLQQNGLLLTQLDGPQSVVSAEEIEASVDAAIMADCELVLVCVKSQDTEDAARQIARHCAGDTTIVSLQNGVTNARVLARHLGARSIAAGMVGFNVVVGGEGRFHRATEGGIVMKDTVKTRALSDALGASGISAAVHSDMQSILWAKLLLNLNNALNVLSDVPLVEQLSDRSYRLVLALMVDEALTALKAARIRPAAFGKVRPRAIPFILRLPNWAFKRAASAMLAMDPHARSSMWEDLQAKRAPEVDYLNGAVAALAREVGTSAKTNDVVIGLVKSAFDEGRSPKLSGNVLLDTVRGSSGN
jgi:2-dehydropantoate 2-reductase